MTDTLIGPGFSDPVFQSQSAFRALLAALSEPGTRQQVAVEITPPEALQAATATALLTLADYETPIWLPPAWRDGPAGAWLRFHCGAALVAEPGKATFAVIDGLSLEPPLSAFDAGSDQFPDRSTTVIVQCGALEGGEATTLTGPGIAGARVIAPSGLHAGFWAEVAANNARYPLGIDLLLSTGDAVVGLPRSTRIGEAN
ncbi:MAG TPA: phosphonate C-P lyase system protein PhnH [Bosea sp. (in: a-proteobacteria)]|jgi:alpha-D-ribose 1-methylphosphonate 5-triphosphate synthase subunit PhnH|uniref:phosphonate C-P lyase system protein PhnH n=1 Tax=Bosea sp. (in: a-proteobacteria) TaxID=1871050 RepID=UPI002E1645BB|nr:phosphonate C-P lyase system protein PhnH [Bosea sp. (in: a-proteobacteria)]